MSNLFYASNIFSRNPILLILNSFKVESVIEQQFQSNSTVKFDIYDKADDDNGEASQQFI